MFRPPELPEFPLELDPLDLQLTLGPLVEFGVVVPVVHEPGGGGVAACGPELEDPPSGNFTPD